MSDFARVSDQKAIAVINEYAPKIIEAHKGVQSNAKTMMEHAIVAGELLIKAKKKVGHGKWAEWVTENCHFSDRTARDYMRMAEHKKQIGRDLPISICGALAKLAKPKPKPPRQDAEQEEQTDTQPASPPDDYCRRTEEDIAADIAREVEVMIQVRDGEGYDLDLVREVLLQKLGFKPTSDVSAPAPTAPSDQPKKKRGRPKGSPNKPKAGNGIEPAPATTESGNGVDTNASAEAMKAKFDEDLTIPESMRRCPESGATS